MQKQNRHQLQFLCQSCQTPILFSVLNSKNLTPLCCKGCGKKYIFEDETLLRHLKQFEALCRQIHASEEILGNTAIAMDVGSHHVQVPFNILLTRLSSVIELKMNDQKIFIAFRVEPLRDIPQLEAEALVSRYE